MGERNTLPAIIPHVDFLRLTIRDFGLLLLIVGDTYSPYQFVSDFYAEFGMLTEKFLNLLLLEHLDLFDTVVCPHDYPPGSELMSKDPLCHLKVIPFRLFLSLFSEVRFRSLRSEASEYSRRV